MHHIILKNIPQNVPRNFDKSVPVKRKCCNSLMRNDLHRNQSVKEDDPENENKGGSTKQNENRDESKNENENGNGNENEIDNENENKFLSSYRLAFWFPDHFE